MITIFDPETGEIEQFVVVGDDRAYGKILTDEGRTFIKTKHTNMPDPAQYFVKQGRVVVPRPKMPVTVSRRVISANGEDVSVVSGLPVPCKVRIDDQLHDVDDGSVELVAKMPTTYRISVEHFPYLPWSVDIVAI